MRIMLPKNLIDIRIDGEKAWLPYLDIFQIGASEWFKFPPEVASELAVCPGLAQAVTKNKMPPVTTWKMQNWRERGFGLSSASTENDSGARILESIFYHWEDVDTSKINKALNLNGSYATDEELFLKAQHLALHVLLFLSSSPEDFELLEPIRVPKTKGKRFFSGLYPAKFIGDSQRVRVRHEPSIIAPKPAVNGSPHAGHWVAGHWRHQSVGPRDAPSTKLILIYPYFAEGNKDGRDESQARTPGA